MSCARAPLLVAALALCACGPDEAPTTDPTDGTTSGCADAPLESWETFVKGFTRTNCQGCHASTVVDRRGAPAHVVFDTRDDAQRLAERMLARAGGEAPTMPPAGGTSADDRERLRLWVECWEAR